MVFDFGANLTSPAAAAAAGSGAAAGSWSEPPTVSETMTAINEACRSRGGVYASYSCKTVSWDDSVRGTIGGGLSCWGANITDTRLAARDGRQLFTVRSDNWNERLGSVPASAITLITGNQRPRQPLGMTTLADFLSNIGVEAEYVGMPAGTNLREAELDTHVSIRFQTTFIPLAASFARSDNGSSKSSDVTAVAGGGGGGDARPSLEFCSRHYNYNTRSDDDPRNLVVLCSSQGVAVQQDGAGEKQLFHHAVNPTTGKVMNHWLEAETSDHSVGGAQEETEEEAAEATLRGKATAMKIGIDAMGTRFNALMTVQVPLVQKPRPLPFFIGALKNSTTGKKKSAAKKKKSAIKKKAAPKKKSAPKKRSSALKLAPASGASVKYGQSFAARVSRGAAASICRGLLIEGGKGGPKRALQPCTVTVVLYNVVLGGVPTEDDVAAAIEDMEQLYTACQWDGRLVDADAAFMKSELTVQDALKIQDKLLAM